MTSGLVPAYDLRQEVEELQIELTLHKAGLATACEIPVLAMALMAYDYRSAILRRQAHNGESRLTAMEYIWDHHADQPEYLERASMIQGDLTLM